MRCAPPNRRPPSRLPLTSRKRTHYPAASFPSRFPFTCPHAALPPAKPSRSLPPFPFQKPPRPSILLVLDLILFAAGVVRILFWFIHGLWISSGARTCGSGRNPVGRRAGTRRSGGNPVGRRAGRAGGGGASRGGRGKGSHEHRVEISLAGGRFQSCLREIRKPACDFEDEKKGIRIKKEDWEKLHVHIASYNNFPTAAGLASSAAGLACLVFTLGKLMNVKEDYGELSSIARQGSGSACRSIYGGFVKWCMGKKDDGSDSMAVQLADETHWNDLVIIIAVVSSKQKETSSTSGMRDSVETSSLLQYRAQTVVPSRVLKMEEAIKNRDFTSFAKLTCADSNQFHAVCLDTSPPIFYMNDTSYRIISLVEKWNHSEGTPQVAYTFDAGPNAVLISPNRKTATLLLKKLLYCFPPQEKDLSSYLVGDKSILSDAGLHSIEDIEALPAPPEMKIPDQKFKGDVSYFICSRLGAGPKVLTDESQALIDSVTGLPKGV